MHDNFTNQAVCILNHCLTIVCILPLISHEQLILIKMSLSNFWFILITLTFFLRVFLVKFFIFIQILKKQFKLLFFTHFIEFWSIWILFLTRLINWVFFSRQRFIFLKILVLALLNSLWSFCESFEKLLSGIRSLIVSQILNNLHYLIWNLISFMFTYLSFFEFHG